MNKKEFIEALRKGLSGVPQDDIERSIEFYSEMIDDRIDDGLTEEEAVEAIGPVNDIVAQILSDISLPKLVKAKVKPKHKLRAWEIALLILGSPVWIPLVAAAGIVFLSVYVVIWSIIISLYAIDLSFAACGVTGVFAALLYFSMGNVLTAVFFIGVSLVSAGLAILLFFGFNQITKGILFLSKKILLSIKSCFIGKAES